MRLALVAGLASAFLAAAGTAQAQSAAPAPSPPAERAKTGDSGLNLKLDEAVAPRRRIEFGPATPGTARGPSDAASSLPALGETPDKSSDFSTNSPGRSFRSLGPRDPIPKDTNPSQR